MTIGNIGQTLSDRLAPIAKVIEAITSEVLHEHLKMDVLSSESEDILTCVLRNVADLSPFATGALESYMLLANVAAAPIPVRCEPVTVVVANAGHARPVGRKKVARARR